jgi:hypothetical protein
MEKRSLEIALDMFSAKACYQPFVDILEDHLLSLLQSKP